MKNVVMGILAIVGLATAARADNVILTLTYSDLSGNYTAADATSGSFNAHAVSGGNLNSAGAVSCLVSPGGKAVFQPGFVAASPFANFVLDMAVVHGSTTGTGVGSFTATDHDGDTITGGLAGSWSIAGGFLAFVGTLGNVIVHDNGATDDTFNGSQSGSWTISSLPGPSPYSGAIVQLTAQQKTFFASNFSDQVTGVTAQVVAVPPPPAAYLAIGGLGMTAAGIFVRRRSLQRS